VKRWGAWLPLAIPIALAALVFGRAIGFPFVNWDDPSHFSDNPLVAHPLARGLEGLFRTREIAYPAPVLLLSFALDRALWGTHPGPYHAENLLLHLTNVGLLFRLGRRMRLSPLEACGVATLFAVHPLVVEPACWVTGRKDLLSTAMIFGAALLAAGRPPRREVSAAWRWVVANALLVLAVLVLPRAVVGAIVVVLLVWGIRPDWRLREIAPRVLPAFGVAVVVVVVGARQLTALGGVPPPRSAGHLIADVAAAWALQLSHVLFPVDLLAYYFRVPGDPPTWAMVATALAAIGALVLVARRAKPDSRFHVCRVGAALALVAYAPVSGVFVIRRWTADSYMYLPLAALGIALVPAIARAWPRSLVGFGRFASLALAAILASLSFAGTSQWSSSVQVWTGSIARYPNEPLSYEHEALALLADGRAAEATPLFLELAERFPDWEDTLDDEVRAYEAVGDPRRAAEVLAKGVRVGSAACIQMYWMRLLTSPSPPDPSQRDLVAIAFRRELGPMEAGLSEPAPFLRAAAVLQAVGLDDLAAEAAAHATELGRARQGRP
jgi:hypothetical protein